MLGEKMNEIPRFRYSEVGGKRIVLNIITHDTQLRSTDNTYGLVTNGL